MSTYTDEAVICHGSVHRGFTVACEVSLTILLLLQYSLLTLVSFALRLVLKLFLFILSWGFPLWTESLTISSHSLTSAFIRSTPSQPNKVGLKYSSAHSYVCPFVHKRFLRFQWNLVCRQRSMTDAWQCAVWPNPLSAFIRSTLRQSPSNKAGLKCPSVCPSIHKRFLRFQWNLVCRQRSMTDAWRYAVWVKVKVTSPWESEIRPFSKAISSPIYNGAGKWPRIVKLGHST